MVAPSRERGLKHFWWRWVRGPSCRSLTGAWIETAIASTVGRSGLVAPSRERGLKPPVRLRRRRQRRVAPSRERGLKRVNR